MVLVADPQLVDPHTYPGRPSFLYSLTIRHTDKYMRRSFATLLDQLVPDSVFFLGDLFDGGREWATGAAKSPDKRWSRYGNSMWFNEYDRLSRLFFAPWRNSLASRPSTRDRKLVASLPGNHDLGFGGGIQLPIRQRFTTFFGPSNRIDVLGNHTFVSLDSVSLSAKQEFQMRANHTNEIWNETEAFLDSVEQNKARLVGRELRAIYGQAEVGLLNHSVQDLGYVDPTTQWAVDSARVSKNVPTVLLSHIPLFRLPGTPCGPLRERWPPSSAPGERDDRNAIAVAFGDQYQNVIAQDLSKEIVAKVGNVRYAFSGDDHDYCEVVHADLGGPAGGVREVTVKAFSWAMGIRKPGFVMVSLWNPVDESGDALPRTRGAGETDAGPLQSHLCLLPDQLGVFIRYGLAFGLTLILLALRAVRDPSASAEAIDLKSPLLPLSTPSTPGSAAGVPGKLEPFSDAFSSSSIPADGQQAQLSVRANGARTRHGMNLATIDEKLAASESRTPKDRTRFVPAQRRNRRSAFRAFVFDVCWSLVQVAVIPWLWYLYLA